MKSSRWLSKRRAFTLVELLVVIAIIGVLVALLLPAIQAAREAARRSTCSNQVRNISIACLNYENATGKMPYGRKFNVWDAYTWTELILPYVEQQAVYDLYWTIDDPAYVDTTGGTATSASPIGDDERMRQARHASIPIYYCPSDETPIPNEMDTAPYGHLRGNYRGCVGGSDMYGGRPASTYYNGLPASVVDALEGDGNALIGAFGVNVPGGRRVPNSYQQLEVPANRLRQFSDGTSNTLLISEGVSPRLQGWGGPLAGMIYGNMGGSLFSAVGSPNASTMDFLIGPCPYMDGDSYFQDTEYPFKDQCTSMGRHPGQGNPGGAAAVALARSLHPGGVNASRADASTQFVSESIDPQVWRALGTRSLGETTID